MPKDDPLQTAIHSLWAENQISDGLSQVLNELFKRIQKLEGHAQVQPFILPKKEPPSPPPSHLGWPDPTH